MPSDFGIGMGAGERRLASRFLTIRDIAGRLNVSTRTVRRWIKSGALVSHHFGGVVRVSEADFMAFLAVKRDR
jgi:excisionase family DNA binding protein